MMEAHGFGEDGSRPARGAWIETTKVFLPVPESPRRAPHGARGLKLIREVLFRGQLASRPARGAWIETDPCSRSSGRHGVAPRTGRVD